MKIAITILQLLCGLAIILIVLLQSGKSEGLSGAIGGGGLGQIAISYGYNRYQTDVLFITVALLIVLMQVIQVVGMKISRKTDKRVRN